MLRTVLKGALPFLSVLSAVFLYQRPDWLIWLALLFAVAAVSGIVTTKCAAAYPRFGAVVVNGWYLMPFCLLAASSYAVIWLTLNAQRFFDPSNTPDEVKALTTTLVGAATAFFGVLWTKDITETKGIFWPSELLRAAWSKVFDGHEALESPRAADAEAAYQAIYLEKFSGGKGWGVSARYCRATLVATWLTTLPR